MSNRFGRNRRRKMRDRIARLEQININHTIAGNDLRKRFAELTERHDRHLRFVENAISANRRSMFNCSIPSELVVNFMQTSISLPVFTLRSEVRDCDKIIDLRVRCAGMRQWGYAISIDALRHDDREYIAYRIGREFVQMILSEFNANKL